MILGAVATVALVWALGHLYWRLRLERSVDAFRRSWGQGWAEEGPVEALPRALGSRAIPRLLREMEQELKKPKPDGMLLMAWAHEVECAVEEADRDWAVESMGTRALPLRLIESREVPEHFSRWWMRESGNFPPAWQWWSGRRRKPSDFAPYPENRSTVNP